MKCPLLLIWGLEDPFTPADGPVPSYFKKLSEDESIVSFVELEGKIEITGTNSDCSQ